MPRSPAKQRTVAEWQISRVAFRKTACGFRPLINVGRSSLSAHATRSPNRRPRCFFCADLPPADASIPLPARRSDTARSSPAAKRRAARVLVQATILGNEPATIIVECISYSGSYIRAVDHRHAHDRQGASRGLGRRGMGHRLGDQGWPARRRSHRQESGAEAIVLAVIGGGLRPESAITAKTPPRAIRAAIKKFDIEPEHQAGGAPDRDG